MEVQKINKSLKQSASEQKVKTKDPLELFRSSVLAGGAGGIKGIGRLFRISDRDKSRTIDFGEFRVICQRRDVDVGLERMKELFGRFDKDDSGQISYDEFLQAIRPPMSKVRLAKVDKAFQKMDTTGDGVIKVEDLIGTYKVKEHPKYKNGEMSEKDVIAEFLESFEVDDHVEATDEGENIEITKEEWLDYFVSVSSSCDSDAYFTLMMSNAWGI